ncbi:MoxR-like ATPase [Ruminococcaceae bacterium YRB3002]|nr:MoxR-like ATPase [Ruminococcaceae bacterium YRB3002]
MEKYQVISEAEIRNALTVVQRINAYYYEKMVGQKDLGTSLLMTLMVNGHILIESVPGLAKTTAAKTMTEACGGKFSRIQCTPDLLPSDIIGTQILNYSTGSFETKLGPVHANFVLLDEINRSSAKTQSAMLEVMQEHQTTIGGMMYPTPEIFMVIATQNPIEQEGTYLLSEAQLDRFFMKTIIDYPAVNEELEIMNRIEKDVFTKSHAVVTLGDIKYVQNLVKRVYLDDSIKNYIVRIIDATRHADKFINKDLAQYITLGSSIRGSICLMEISKAVALLSGRDYVTPDDVKAFAKGVLRHRVTLNFAAVADGVKEDQIIEAILGAVPAP